MFFKLLPVPDNINHPLQREIAVLTTRMCGSQVERKVKVDGKLDIGETVEADLVEIL